MMSCMCHSIYQGEKDCECMNLMYGLHQDCDCCLLSCLMDSTLLLLADHSLSVGACGGLGTWLALAPLIMLLLELLLVA